MSSIAPEVTLVHFTFEKIHNEYPSVEYRIFEDKPRFVDIRADMSPEIAMEVKRVPVDIFKKVIPSHIPYEYGGTPHVEENRIALTYQAKDIVDMYVSNAVREKNEKIAKLISDRNNLRDELNTERSKSLWEHFKDWFNGRRFSVSLDM